MKCKGCDEQFDADYLNQYGFCIDCGGDECGPDCPDYPDACPECEG